MRPERSETGASHTAADGPAAVSDAQAAVLEGKPYQSSQFGPPRPSFQVHCCRRFPFDCVSRSTQPLL